METYLTKLESSTIPLPAWAVVLGWLVIFISAHVLFKKARLLSRGQNFINIGISSGLVKEQTPKLMIVQVMFSVAVFAYASFFGGGVFTFFVGGWIVMSALSVAINLRSLFFSKAIAKPDAAKGSVTLSEYLIVKDAAYQLFGGAVFCLILGVFTAHLALMGGALFLTATGFGYLRKVRRSVTDVQPD